MGIHEQHRDGISRLRERAAAQREHDHEFNVAAACLMGDLRYPVSKDGSIIDMSYFTAVLAYHLVRCGWRVDPERREIKPRRITAQGVIQGAIEWVPMDAPDDPLANLNNMTMKEINKLPPIQRAEAIRRIGGPELPDLPRNPGWKTETHVNIEDAPDVNDGIEWSGRKWEGKQ